jgi:hypothetical protein
MTPGEQGHPRSASPNPRSSLQGSLAPTTTAILLMVSAVLVALNAHGAWPSYTPRLQWTAEITSYGEQSENITALFLPLFAQYGFTASRETPALNDGQRFEDAHRDFITMAPAVNCVRMSYHSFEYETLVPSLDKSRATRKRADNFRDEMLRLVAKLPEPRPNVAFKEDTKSLSCDRSDTQGNVQ